MKTKRRLRISIRYQMFILVGLVFATAMISFLFLGLDFVKDDKAQYVLDLNASVLFGVLIFFGSLLASIYFSRRLTLPLHQLEAATQQVASGNFDIQVPVKGRDEVQSLAEAFNTMATELGNREKKLTREARLEQSEQRLCRLIEQMPYGICVLRDGLVSFVNPIILSYLGCKKADELLGRPIKEFFDDSTREEILDKVLDVQARGLDCFLENEIIRLDNRRASMEFALLPLEFDGAPATLMVARDVSEEKQLRSSIIHAERMASVGTLAAGVSHEINNPLAYIIANYSFAQDELQKIQQEVQKLPKEWQATLDLPAKLRELQEVISEAQEGADQVRHIVRDLKTFVRDSDNEMKPSDVRTILDSTISMAWNQIRHRARLVKDFHPVAPVLASPTRLGQVFLNILVNAAHAIEEGNRNNNTIRITVKNLDHDHVEVEISDTGCGISKDSLPKIFGPFFTTKSVGQGTGLGLYISYSIIESLGGEIMVTSEPDKGTSFRILLPASQLQPSEPPHDSIAPANWIKHRGRVLVIEDEVLLGKAMRRILKPHEVVVATDGEKALDLLFNHGGFDIILCDLLMPNMTGMDVFERVCKEAPELKDRFVFMTGSAFTVRAREFMANIPNLRLDKPLDPDYLRSIIQKYVAQNRPEQATQENPSGSPLP